MKKLLVFLLCFFLFLSKSFSATYYIRADGGTALQCNGKFDLPYPGEGEGQNCAWAHPFWALNEYGEWKILGGDILIIGPGSYMIGYGAPNTSSWCSAEGAFGCVLPPIPSGTSYNPTKILGTGYSSACSNPPELWGTQRVFYVLSLENSSNVEINCLEITDHSSCVEFHSNPSISCERETYPFGEWASIGIYANNSSNITLKNLNIHGIAETCLGTAALSNWTLENVRLAGCGGSGWNGDYGENPSNSGTMRFKNFIVEWNGCAENYPGGQPDHCWAQSAGGYGDGVGLARTGGHWIIEDSIFRYNTSDGLDMLYVGVDNPDTMVEIYRTKAYSNSGNQLKVGGSALISNSLVIGDCAFFYQKSFAQEMGDADSGDICRAGGGAISINLGQGDNAKIINSTVASQGWALIEAQCQTLDFPDQPPCNGTEYLEIKNSIFRGYSVFNLEENLSDFIGDGDPYGFTAGKVDYNILYNVDYDVCPQGANDICKNPLLVNDNLQSFDGHLKQTSPAIDKGTSNGAPSDDLDGNLRPQGSGIDIGAYEFVGTQEEVKLFIPVVTRATGQGQSNWVTDLMVYNNSNSSGQVEFTYTPAGSNGNTTNYKKIESIKAKEGLFFSNIVQNLFGFSNNSGSLRIRANLSIISTSRTYNDEGTAGTYGQFISAFDISNAVGSGESAFLFSLRQNERFRTNIGFSEIGGKETQVKLSFYEKDGSFIGNSNLTIPPYSLIQKNITEFNIPSIDDGFLKFEITNGSSLIGYISVIDQITHDAIFVPAQKPSTQQGAPHQFIPVIARAKGGYNSNWKTDLFLFNQLPATQNISLEFYTPSSKYTSSLSLENNKLEAIEDLVSKNFPQISQDVSGSLHIYSNDGVMIVSRTYNDQDVKGTFGQNIPGWGSKNQLKTSDVGFILQISSNSNFRTNFGFSEFEGKGAEVKVQIYKGAGEKLGEKNYTVEGWKNLQVNNIFLDMGITQDVNFAYAKITVISGGSIIAYASVVDNKTGDAIFIPAIKLQNIL